MGGISAMKRNRTIAIAAGASATATVAVLAPLWVSLCLATVGLLSMVVVLVRAESFTAGLEKVDLRKRSGSS